MIKMYRFCFPDYGLFFAPVFIVRQERPSWEKSCRPLLAGKVLDSPGQNRTDIHSSQLTTLEDYRNSQNVANLVQLAARLFRLEKIIKTWIFNYAAAVGGKRCHWLTRSEPFLHLIDGDMEQSGSTYTQSLVFPVVMIKREHMRSPWTLPNGSNILRDEKPERDPSPSSSGNL